VPIRSPRGRAAAYRAVWQWPLRSPARLAITLVVVVAVALGVSVAVSALGGGPDRGVLAGPASSSSPTARSAPRTSPSGAGPAPTPAPAPTVLPPVAELEPSALPLSQAPPVALDVAARWSAAWLRPAEGTTAQQWLEGLRPTTTQEYLGVLSGVDPANIPSTRVTGEPRAVRVAHRSVEVEVPTDALTLIVLVVDSENGWRVAGYDRV
jgi:hypothetical protein